MMIANSSYTPYFRYFAEQAYKEKDIEFTFIFLHHEKPGTIEAVKEFNVKSYWLKFDYRKDKKLQYLRLSLKLFFLFKKIKPDVVHTNLFDDSLPGLLAAKWAGVKKRIITKQDTSFHFLFAKKGIKYDIKNNKNATHIIPCSEESKEFIIKHEAADINKIKVIHHGVDEIEFTAATEDEKKYIKEKYNPQGKILIGTVSRLVDSKGYQYIFSAMEILASKRNDILFVGAGGGPFHEKFKQIITEKKIENCFILAGHIDKKHIPAFYQSLSVYVHASIYEPFGFVIPEAIFNNVPLVTTHTGASRDALKHMESAYFIPEKNPQAIADAIEFVLANDNSAMVKKAKEIARKKYTLNRMWNEYLTVYRNEK